VLDKDGVRLLAYSTALRHKASLAGRSGHEAQGSGSRWGEVPKIRRRTPTCPTSWFAPSTNWAGSNALARTPRYSATHQSC